jgi:hypothetical protein
VMPQTVDPCADCINSDEFDGKARSFYRLKQQRG